MKTLIGQARTSLRSFPLWRDFREMQREGFDRAFTRMRIQRQILSTKPLATASTGDIEVRVLTWRRDWINLIWMLKSFYFFAGVNFPLYIHDGGLDAAGTQALREHFPNARLITQPESDQAVRQFFQDHHWHRCLEYRLLNPTTRKLFDFFCMSQAKVLLSIDSDIVFFRQPELLINPDLSAKLNYYNRDSSYQYSLPLTEIKSRFGVSLPPLINSGLSRCHREALRFDLINDWLADADLFADRWVTEQTLHAMASAHFGVELLPASYALGTEPGMPDDCICKHYPGYFRPLLYEEGMAELIRRGFLQEWEKWSGPRPSAEADQ